MFCRTLNNEGYTLASMIRDELFYQGATFASCVVSHPQSYDLEIMIDGEDPKEILKSAIERSTLRLEACTKALDNFVNFSNLQKNIDVVEEDSQDIIVTSAEGLQKDNVRKSSRMKKTANKTDENSEDKLVKNAEKIPKESDKRKRRSRQSEE